MTLLSPPQTSNFLVHGTFTKHNRNRKQLWLESQTTCWRQLMLVRLSLSSFLACLQHLILSIMRYFWTCYTTLSDSAHATLNRFKADICAWQVCQGWTHSFHSLHALLWPSHQPHFIVTLMTHNCTQRLRHTHQHRDYSLCPTPSLSDAEKLVHNFVSSRLDYCNALRLWIPSKSILKLQRQNSAARVVMRV